MPRFTSTESAKHRTSFRRSHLSLLGIRYPWTCSCDIYGRVRILHSKQLAASTSSLFRSQQWETARQTTTRLFRGRWTLLHVYFYREGFTSQVELFRQASPSFLGMHSHCLPPVISDLLRVTGTPRPGTHRSCQASHTHHIDGHWAGRTTPPKPVSRVERQFAPCR